jgi:ATP-dependent Clp protease ATP-binding subunit ClpA
MPVLPGVTMRTHEVFAIAHDLADRLGHVSVTPLHVLLAILREGRSPAMVVLYVLGVPFGELEREIDAELSAAPIGQVPATDHAWTESDRELLRRAKVESLEVRHSHIGCEHLLLAFASDESSVAAELLARHGVHMNDARAALVRVMGEPVERGGAPA